MAADGDTGKSSSKKKMQTAALLVGAAGLLLFIIGVKRRYRTAEGQELDATPPEDEDEESGERAADAD